MSDMIEYIDNFTSLFSLEFENFECYFLLFESLTDWGNKFSQYILELKEMKISKSKDPKNPFYFNCITMNENLKLKTNESDFEFIFKICQNYFKERTFLIKDSNNKISINFNFESISKIPNVKIIGIFLNPLEGFVKFLDTNQDNLKIESVEQYKNITVSSIVISDENNNQEEEENQEEENQEEEVQQEQNEGQDFEDDQEQEQMVEEERSNNEIEEEEEGRNFDEEFEDVNNNLSLDEEDQIKQKKHSRQIHNISEEIQEEKRIKKGRRKEQVDEDKCRNDVTNFLSNMREAILLDENCLRQRSPALHKLKMVKKIENFLYNYNYQKFFLDFNGLEVLQEWIKRNRDGTYPVFNQINSILDCLNNLNVTITNLRNSSIGAYVLELKQSNISKQIVKKASDIIEKWSRIIWDINTNYSDIELENKHYLSVFANRKIRRNEIEENEEDEDRKVNLDSDQPKQKKSLSGGNSMDIYSHAKIPKKSLFDFTRKPENSEFNRSKTNSINRARFYFSEKKKSGRNKSE